MGIMFLFRKRSEDISVRHRKEKALHLFREWNKVTDLVSHGTSYEGELESLIEDAVEIGMFGRVLRRSTT